MVSPKIEVRSFKVLAQQSALSSGLSRVLSAIQWSVASGRAKSGSRLQLRHKASHGDNLSLEMSFSNA